MSRLFTTIHVLSGTLGMTVILSILAERAIAKVKQKLQPNLIATESGQLAMTIGQHEHTPPSLLRTLIKACSSVQVIIAFLWLALGTFSVYQYQQFSLIQSIYFAVTAVSTGGLQGVTRDDTSLFWTALYCLAGVPIFGLATSKLATAWLEHRAGKKVAKKVKDQTLNKKEFLKFASSLKFATNTTPRHGDDELQVMDLSEYLCMELAVLGLVKKEHLKVIVDRFMVLDEDHSGYVTLEEAYKGELVPEVEETKELRKKKQ